MKIDGEDPKGLGLDDVLKLILVETEVKVVVSFTPGLVVVVGVEP